MMAPEFHRVEWFLAARHEISSPRYIVTFALSSLLSSPSAYTPSPPPPPFSADRFSSAVYKVAEATFRNTRRARYVNEYFNPSINNPFFNSCVLFGSLFFLAFLSFFLSLLFFPPFFSMPRSKQERCDFAFINNPVCAIAFFPFC